LSEFIYLDIDTVNFIDQKPQMENLKIHIKRKSQEKKKTIMGSNLIRYLKITTNLLRWAGQTVPLWAK
jgi:hypothetical protein